MDRAVELSFMAAFRRSEIMSLIREDMARFVNIVNCSTTLGLKFPS